MVGRAEVWAVVILLIVAIVGILLNLNYNEREGNGMAGNKSYIGNSIEECSRIQFLCALGYVRFNDEKGCGCEFIGENASKVERNYCSSGERPEICYALYDPVCGVDESGIEKTYSNNCVACSNEDVAYWTEGECPAG